MKNFFLFLIIWPLMALPKAIDQANQPELLNEKMIINLQELPTRGKLDQKPWSGDYWRSSRGGISYRWFYHKEDCPKRPESKDRFSYKIKNMEQILNQKKKINLACLSPSEKFDLYMGDTNWTLTKLERKRTNILKTIEDSPEYEKDYKIQDWFGLCHAWAPLTLHFQEPKPVVIKNHLGLMIPFGSSDLKALMALGANFSDPSIPKFKNAASITGRRCEQNLKKAKKDLQTGKISRNEYVKMMKNESCLEDINAGTFHVVLTNLIGLKKEGFIIDRDRESQIWNQPVFAYQTKITSYQGRIPEDSHLKTTKLFKVSTITKMIVEVGPAWNSHLHERFFRPWEIEDEKWYPYDRQYSNKSKEVLEKKYEYILETDYKHNILGGRWLSKDHPDFIWKSHKIFPFESLLQHLKTVYQKGIKSTSSLENFKAIVVKKLKVIKIKNNFKNEVFNLFKRLFGQKKKFDIFLHNEIIRSYNEKRSPDMKKITFWIKHGASVDNPDFSYVAATTNNLPLMELIIEKQAPISEDAIWAAVINSYPEILKILLKNQANPNIYKKKSNTPQFLLHTAVKIGNEKVVKLLLDYGGERFINEYHGELGDTAIMTSIRHKENTPSLSNLKIMKLLEDHGGVLNIRSGRGQSYSIRGVAQEQKGPYAAFITKFLIERGIRP